MQAGFQPHSGEDMHGNQVRDRLQQRRNELHARSGHIDSDLRGGSVPVEGGFADQAAAHGNDAVLEAIRESAETELRQIDNALQRIADGSYERCDNCGSSIGQERLNAVPYATKCIVCAG
jgi:DnaK suppressor protein